MSEEISIRVNFGRPMPLFPLASVTLMPHAVLPVHIFEDRYRQMISDALDGPGQIAMGVFAGSPQDWMSEYEGKPPLRRAVCVGQIVHHDQLPDGRFNVALHGVCRARIVSEYTDPDADDGDAKLYRRAMLEPIGVEEIDEATLAPARARVLSLLSETRLQDLTDAKPVVSHLNDADVPTSAILELVAFSLLNDAELRYRLLDEGDAFRRSMMIERELVSLQGLLELAAPQRSLETPKGVSWN